MWSVCILCWTLVGLTNPITAFPDTRAANGTATTNNSRIIGGADAQPGEWPWQAMIKKYNNKGKFGFICGGSLISNMWVLSAAHCFNTSDVTQFQVVLGAYLLNLSDRNWIRRTPQAILCHTQYSKSDTTIINDICLVQLSSAVEYTDYISPISLPSAGDVPDETCVITGWGFTEPWIIEPGLPANRLQEADVHVFSKSRCIAWYSENNIFVSEEAHICAGTTDSSRAFCNGDSGGPLACRRSIGSNFTLFGITSFGILGCYALNRPGVFTDVTNYLNWIAEIQEPTTEPSQCFDATTIRSCGSTITENWAILRSPIENEDTWLYPSSSVCSWVVVAPANHTIKIEFICHFSMEPASEFGDCTDGDYVRISEPLTSGASHCGTDLPASFLSTGNRVIVRFRSDSDPQTGRGFVIRVVFSAAEDCRFSLALLLLSCVISLLSC